MLVSCTIFAHVISAAQNRVQYLTKTLGGAITGFRAVPGAAKARWSGVDP